MTEPSEKNDTDRWLAALQEAILERERAVFSAKVLEEARQPQNMGIMLEPDGHALEWGACGDTMEFFVRVRDKCIEAVTFMTDGCGPTVACGSKLTQMVQSRSLERAAAIEAADLIIALDGLPPEHVHCATLAVKTLQEAIADHQQEEGAGYE